jgi:TetR/AcrR family transcriptional regulator, mexJK operon transcriptional repressor
MDTEIDLAEPLTPVPIRKRAARLASGGTIREAAARLFLDQGYQGTSMDDIAAAAGVSKQTIYTHFTSKEQLFGELVLGNADRVSQFLDRIEALVIQPNLAEGLEALARDYIRFVIRPEVLRLRRLVLGEAGRFPELARRYYELVPERVYQALAKSLQTLADQQRLSIDHPMTAAGHFAWLALGMPLDRGMFSPSKAALSDAEVDDQAQAAVRVFLAAYGSHTS